MWGGVARDSFLKESKNRMDKTKEKVKNVLGRDEKEQGLEKK